YALRALSSKPSRMGQALGEGAGERGGKLIIEAVFKIVCRYLPLMTRTPQLKPANTAFSIVPDHEAYFTNRLLYH
ncbi:MAG: hypothetical protein ACLPZF_15660, partial [Candidatus Acidiferrales bacterium]